MVQRAQHSPAHSHLNNGVRMTQAMSLLRLQGLHVVCNITYVASHPAVLCAAPHLADLCVCSPPCFYPVRGGDERRVNPRTLLDKLQGYDYDPSAQHEEYPDDSISQVADDDRVRQAGSGSSCVLFLAVCVPACFVGGGGVWRSGQASQT